MHPRSSSSLGVLTAHRTSHRDRPRPREKVFYRLLSKKAQNGERVNEFQKRGAINLL
jgi:hypothetical protein